MTQKVKNIITFVFLFIILITAISAVLANLGLFGLDPNSNFAKTTLGAVLVEIVAAVIGVWKTGVLQSPTISATINFSNNDGVEDIDLNPNGCFYEVRDMKANIKSKGKLGIVWSHGGWECRFPSPQDQYDSIILKLTEKNGNKWEVRPFYPLTKEVEAQKEI
ncbi:MAG: hypothetical protein ACFFDN_33315 [Candidatus Hodarchaeota archaeon]